MLLEIMVPKHNQEGGTMVIPGYGRIGDEHDVLEYRDMVTIIRDRVQAAIKKRMTLAQIKAMKPSPTYEYEPRFNRDPAWTAEMFVEAIYKNLERRASSDAKADDSWRTQIMKFRFSVARWRCRC